MRSMLSCCLIVSAACGETSSDQSPVPGRTRPPTAEIGESPEMVVAYRGPSTAVEMGRGALDFAGQVIQAASNLSGAMSARIFGTLTEESGGRVRYEAAPADKLVVERADGRRFEIVVAELAGTGSDATSFFRGDHVLRFRLVGGEVSADLYSTRRGSSRAAGIRGEVVIDGQSLDVDLRREGTESFDIDQSGSRFFDDHALLGTIERDTDHVEVRERWTFELVSARTGATGSRMETASSVVRAIDSNARIGGQTFEWRGVRTRKAFRNGKPNELDSFWQAEGAVLVDGAVLGRVTKFVEAYGESGGFVGFNLVTSNGAVELERFSAY